MKKNIWIWNHYATCTYYEEGGRHYWFAKNLIKKGYNVTIFCANIFHNSNKSIAIENKKYTEKEKNDIKFVFIKTSPSKGNGLDRINNMYNFYRNLCNVSKKFIVKQKIKPDVILASSVHPLTLIAGIKVGEKFNIPCICEVRDLWPESIVEYANKINKNNLLIKLLYKGEKWIYKKADRLIFTMPGGIDYIKKQGWDKEIDLSKIYHINNGVDLETFIYNKKVFKIEDKDLQNENLFKVVYTGSIRRVNNLGIILDIAKKIDIPNLKFLIWGQGDEVENLKKRIMNENIKNVVFKGSVQKKYIPYILTKSDVNLLHFENTDLLKFGLSTNKLFEYYASLKPILSTVNFNYDEINGKCGITIHNQNQDEIKKSINTIYNFDEKTKEEISNNCIKLSKKYDFKSLTNDLIHIIENI